MYGFYSVENILQVPAKDVPKLPEWMRDIMTTSQANAARDEENVRVVLEEALTWKGPN